MAHRDMFTRIAQTTSRAMGNPLSFIIALSMVLLWALSGPLFGFGDTWQLVINTTTTIITFLMVFLIQNSQNRDTEALQLKLDELIRATNDASNALMDIEELSSQELDRLKARYDVLARQAREKS